MSIIKPPGLIGIPQPEPERVFVLPKMRGFPCTVAAPQMNALPGTSPKQGLGVGFAQTGEDVTFFLSMHNEEHDVLVAHLDFERFQVLCGLFADAGRQAMAALEGEPT